ncbi:MAG TPA: trypsin-like peptidase domain-containing protein [Gemmatimonadaceae bacterium]|nr:trypsin-like peptidase domain-containing protein [Gemmatimonadaceae bacterium]
MSTSVTDALERGAQVAGELADVAERVRAFTVDVAAPGAGGTGSGVIWRADGLIITNAHVARAERMTVTMHDGRACDAAVVARDDARDLAALTVDAVGLEPAAVRDARTLRPGELVLAVGSPLGIRGAVAAGIVHAPSARGPGGRRWVRADLRLAPGNSGGPLTDALGCVVGINSMIVAGLAMAIPSDVVQRFVDGPMQPSLGIVARPVLVSLAGDPALGLLVLDVRPASVASASGLATGDVLIAAGGHPFDSPNDLMGELDEAGPDGVLPLTLLRGGRRMTLDARLRGGGSRVEAA